MEKIKRILLKLIEKLQSNEARYMRSGIYYGKFIKYRGKKKIFHMLTPIHGNMGDQAIAYATNKFLADNFKDYKIVEVYRKDLYKYGKSIKKVMTPNDYIFTIGGGNMGNLWVKEEIDRRFIIDKFNKNKIISMPQTITFTKDEAGKLEFEKTIHAYNNNKNLTVIAREKKSFKIMKEAFNENKVLICPDIVLYLNEVFNKEEFKRINIMTCLRSDKEGLLGDGKIELMKNLEKNYDNVIHYDTVIKKQVYKENREVELINMLNKFKQAKLVITDRLHGMIFCVITNTPCIVTKSLDHKVTGTYEWIKELNYIKMVENLEFGNIKSLIKQLIELEDKNSVDLNGQYFNNLSKEIRD